MEEKTKKNLKSLYKTLGICRNYEHALGIIGFDFETASPAKAKEEQAEIMSFFSNEYFKLMTSNKMKKLTVELYEHKDELDELDQILVKNL